MMVAGEDACSAAEVGVSLGVSVGVALSAVVVGSSFASCR